MQERPVDDLTGNAAEAVPTRPDRQYHVYVIQLSDEVGARRNPDLPCVYVGQSACTPEERFRQHLAGYRASRFVRRYGLFLRPRLYRRYNPMPTRQESEAMEAWLRETLERRGYTVFGGH